MEFVIARQTFADELNKLQSVVGKKISIPILGCIKIEAEGTGIKLTATDIETTLYSRLESNLLAVSQEGAMCISAKRIVDIVRLAADGPIKITSDENDWIHIIAKGSRFKVPGLPVASWPDLPKHDNISWLEVPASHLRAMLPSVKYSITNEESRLNLRGVKLEIEGSEARMIATDGHRISLASAKLDSLMLEDYEVLIPVEVVDELIKLLPEQKDLVGIGLSSSLFFRLGSRVLSTRLMTGKFPTYQMPFQNLGTYEHSGTFKADELSKSIKRAMLCAQDDSAKGSQAAIVLSFEPSVLKISAASSDLGEANEILDSNFTGQMKIYCNGKFLLDYLEQAGSGVVKIEIKDGLSQVYLTSAQDGIESFYCLMPMRSPSA